MRREELKTITAKRSVTTHLRCDCCGAEATNPEQGFDDCSPTLPAVEVKVTEFWPDGDAFTEGVDLCRACGDWLVAQIRSGEIRRKPAPAR